MFFYRNLGGERRVYAAIKFFHLHSRRAVWLMLVGSSLFTSFITASITHTGRCDSEAQLGKGAILAVFGVRVSVLY